MAPLSAAAGVQPSWSKTVTVGPVPPGGALRFWAQNASTIECPSAPCWLYGSVLQEGREQQGAARGTALRADIGVPLQSLKSLIGSKTVSLSLSLSLSLARALSLSPSSHRLAAGL